MAKKFVIAAGGTGSMCVQALIFLLACGCADATDTYHILLVDKDKRSDALRACQDLVKAYKKLRAQMKDANAFQVMPEIELSKWNFTTELCTAYTLNTGRSVAQMRSMTLSSLLNPNGNSATEELLKTFYDEDELKVDLDKGFYGHPNIGAAVFSYVQERFLSPMNPDINGNQVPNPFMSELYAALNRGPTHVYVYGSVFGGTGASVIPNIVEALRTIHGTGPNSDWGKTRMILGGTLVMPYFRLPACPDDSVENMTVRPRDTLFAEQTKEALQYYEESGMLEPGHMNNLLLVGTKEGDETSEIYSRGEDQKQHFHMVLQAAAVAGCRFFGNRLEGMDTLINANGDVVQAPGKLLLWKIRPLLGANGTAIYHTLSAAELGMEREYTEMDKFFRYSVIFAFYLKYRFNKPSSQMAEDRVVAGTIKQMRDESGAAVPHQNLRPSAEDTKKYYQDPVESAVTFCREYLKYYFDVAMSGYSWSKYHEHRGQSEVIDNKVYMRYSVKDTVAENAMADAVNRWVDIVNLDELQKALETSAEEDVLKSTTLGEMMSFDYRDTAEKAPDGSCLRQAYHLQGFDEHIGTLYEQETLRELGLERGFFGRMRRDNVKFSDVLNTLYNYC